CTDGLGPELTTDFMASLLDDSLALDCFVDACTDTDSTCRLHAGEGWISIFGADLSSPTDITKLGENDAAESSPDWRTRFMSPTTRVDFPERNALLSSKVPRLSAASS